MVVDNAQQRFGRPTQCPVIDELPLINSWKTMAEAVDEVLQAERNRKAALKRTEELVKLQTMRNFVEEKTVIFNRRQELLRHMADEHEQHRLQRREFDRAERRRLRFEEYLNSERQHFMFEDNRSYQLREYLCERQRQSSEREEMFEAECEQCEIDHFWGIDAFEQRMRSEEHRLRVFYEQRVREANAPLAMLGQVKATKKREVNLQTIGSLKEDVVFSDDDKLRREMVVRRLQAGEIRSKLKVRLPTKFF
jgi:hypothetical protein